MKKLKTTIKITVSDIKVEEGHYSFKFKVNRDGDIHEDSYGDNFENGQTDKQWKKILEKGEALNIAIENLL